MSNHAQEQLREAAQHLNDAADDLARDDFIRYLTERESFLLDNAIHINARVGYFDE